MNSADLPRWMWRDPAEVAERVESGTCKGCGWIVRFGWETKTEDACGKGRRFGVRCKHYLEEKAA